MSSIYCSFYVLSFSDLYMHQRVFLKAPPNYDFVPACLYVVSISKGVNIVVAAELCLLSTSMCMVSLRISAIIF